MICILAVCWGALTQPVAAEPAARFYVAPNGSDRNPGTPAKPFATVERARDAVRRANGAMRADLGVEIAPGTYRLGQPLVFGPEDSGRNGYQVAYRAARGGEVVLSGGRRVEGWTRDEQGRYRARVDLDNFRQLWVNGRRATRARGAAPAGLEFWGEHKAVIRPAAPGVIFGTLEVTAEAGYRTTDTRLAEWRNPADMELGYYNSWSHMICRIDRVERDGDRARIVMAQPGFFLASRKGGVQAGLPAYLENALELLDQPGEWYFDRSTHTLYYLPREGEDMATAEVIAPALERLVEVRGTLDAPVTNLRFEGITFAHATWLRPSQLGHPDVQADFILAPENVYQRPEHERGFTPVNGECPRSPANVLVEAARGVQFERCTFTALGGAGLDLQKGAQGNVIEGCRFEDISASGLQVGEVQKEDHHPSDPRRTVKGNRITNNVIRRCGVEYEDSIGVFCGYTDGTVVAHNEISDLPYTGVSVGWGWGMPDAGGGAYTSPIIYDTPTVCGNNRIETNHIHHVMLKRNDGGGIYTLSRQPGTIIRGNHLHDNGPGAPGGIYLDEGSADIEVTGNLVYGVARAMNYNNHAQNRMATCREHDNLFGMVRTVAGVVGKALQATGSLVEVPHAQELEPAQLTVEAWVRIAAFPGGWDPRRWAVCKGGNEWVEGNYSLYIDRGNVGAYLCIGGGRENSFEVVSKTLPLRLNEWLPIAFTYDGRTVRVYCDGGEVAAQEVNRPRTPSNVPLALGGRQDRYSFFDGDLDEVRIYNRALTAEEVRHNCEAVRHAQPGREPDALREGRVGYWTFDDLAVDQGAVDRIAGAAGLEAKYRDLLSQRLTGT